MRDWAIKLFLFPQVIHPRSLVLDGIRHTLDNCQWVAPNIITGFGY